MRICLRVLGWEVALGRRAVGRGNERRKPGPDPDLQGPARYWVLQLPGAGCFHAPSKMLMTSMQKVAIELDGWYGATFAYAQLRLCTSFQHILTLSGWVLIGYQLSFYVLRMSSRGLDSQSIPLPCRSG